MTLPTIFFELGRCYFAAIQRGDKEAANVLWALSVMLERHEDDLAAWLAEKNRDENVDGAA